MPFTVQDLLDLPVLAGARPEVLVGQDLDRRPVRWIHSSEIYEIWSLLKGGEALLTTGLGLVGNSPTALDVYCRNLADRNVAVLMLELGRTFPVPPQHLVDAAAANGLPLVALHGVVPFIDITETVHPLLVADEVEQLRLQDRTVAELNRLLLDGRGLHELVAASATVCQAPVGLYSVADALLAGADVTGSEPVLSVPVGTGPWASLAVAAPDTPRLRRLAELCATSVGIALAHEGRVSPTRRTAAVDLLRDLASGRYLSSSQIASRAGTLGLMVRPGQRVLAIVVMTTTLTSVHSGLNATTEAARRALGPALVAEVDGNVLVATAVQPSELRRLSAFADAVDAELRATVGGSVVRLAAGPMVDDVGGLVRSLPAALEAGRVGGRADAGLSDPSPASDLEVYNLLSSVVADADLERFVEEQLGPLLEQDARTGSDLVPTLDAYLEAGLSKTGAAAALGVRRQTLYARLERIARLLGGLSFDDRQRRTALDLALVSWRMRSSAASHRP